MLLFIGQMPLFDGCTCQIYEEDSAVDTIFQYRNWNAEKRKKG